MGEFAIFATRIKTLRESFGMTQKEFSQFIGIKQQTLSGYERGLMKPPLDIVTEIAKKCNISIDWLCGLTDKKTYSNIPQTLADILIMLFLIDEYSDIQIYENEDCVSIKNNDGNFCGVEKSKIHEIGFQPYTIDEIISDWQKMRNLYERETIDKDVYALWKEKTLEKAKNFSPSGSEKQNA